MVEFTLRGLRLRFTFGFFAVWGWLMLSCKDSHAAVIALASCILHEWGHIGAMLISRVRISRLTFYSGGIKLRTRNDTGEKGLLWELAILSAGCAVNLIICIFAALANSKIWFLINLSLFLFNLLPISSLDGGRIVKALVISHFPCADIDSAQKATDIILGIALAAVFLLHGRVSFTLPLAMGLVIAESSMNTLLFRHKKMRRSS